LEDHLFGSSITDETLALILFSIKLFAVDASRKSSRLLLNTAFEMVA
jgi:hypothetical protein